MRGLAWVDRLESAPRGHELGKKRLHKRDLDSLTGCPRDGGEGKAISFRGAEEGRVGCGACVTRSCGLCEKRLLQGHNLG